MSCADQQHLRGVLPRCVTCGEWNVSFAGAERQRGLMLKPYRLEAIIQGEPSDSGSTFRTSQKALEALRGQVLYCFRCDSPGEWQVRDLRSGEVVKRSTVPPNFKVRRAVAQLEDLAAAGIYLRPRRRLFF